jgi:hypothetical protein
VQAGNRNACDQEKRRETVNGWMGNAMCYVYEREIEERVQCIEIGMKEDQERQAIETKHAAFPSNLVCCCLRQWPAWLW